MDEVDENFYERADGHILLSNHQITEETGRGKVSASFMFGLARFNAWVSACSFQDSEQMRQARQETVDYFVAEYRKMLEENLDDYISNFDTYMKINNGS